MTDISPSIFFSKNGEKYKENIVVQSLVHTSKIPENTLWPKFESALNFWFKVPQNKLGKINELIYVARVIRNQLDDVSENVQLRNGSATANSVYGSPDCMNAAYYGCFTVLEKLRDLENFEAVLAGSKYFKDWTKGQGLEIYWRDNVICPKESEYLKMATYKTGSLIEFTFKLLQIFGDNKSNFDNLIQILAKFFHLYDDYANLKSIEERFLNRNGHDIISEGKLTFPVVHAMWSHPEDVQLINILRQKSKEQEVINYFLKVTEKFGGFEYTKQALEKLKTEALAEMKKVTENPDLVQILENIVSGLK